MLKNSIYFSLLLLLFSCSKTDKLKSTYESFPNSKSLKGTVVNFNESFFLPQFISYIDNRLVILDNWKNKAIHIFDLNTQKRLGSGGIIGSSSGEVLSAWTITNIDNKSFWVYDLTQGKLVNFNIDSVIKSTDYHPTKQIKFSTDSMHCYFPILLNDSLIVSPSYSKNGRIAYLNKNGKLIKSIGAYPLDLFKGGANRINSQAYQSAITSNPSQNKIALAARYADQIDVFKSSGEELFTIIGPDRFIPEYKLTTVFNNPVVQFSPKSRFGYLYMQSTDKYIYALYSGRSRKDFPGKANFGQSIHVFDWDGNPIKEYKLDQDIFAFAINEKENTLYAIQHYPKSQVVKFSL